MVVGIFELSFRLGGDTLLSLEDGWTFGGEFPLGPFKVGILLAQALLIFTL